MHPVIRLFRLLVVLVVIACTIWEVSRKHPGALRPLLVALAAVAAVMLLGALLFGQGN